MADHYLNGENGNGHGEETRDVSLRDFLSVLFRRKGIVATVFLAAVLVVILLNARSEVLYESSSTIRVSRGEKESAFNSRIRLLTWEEELNSEIETIMSQQIVELAQERLEEEGARDSNGLPIDLTARNVRATTSGKSAVVYISYKDGDPKAARVGCSAITQAYSDFRLRVRAVPQVDAFFREEIENLREQLDEWEQERAKFMNEESVVKISDERLQLLDLRKTTELDLTRVRASLAETEAKAEVLRTRLLNGADELDLYAFADGENRDDQVLYRMRAELVAEQSSLFAAEAQYTEDHPQVKAGRDRVQLQQDAIRTEMRRYLSHLEARAEVLEAREDALLRTLSVADAELSSLPEKEARLAGFDRVLEQLQANYTALVDKQIQARIEQSGSSDWNVLILKPAASALPIRVNDYVRLAVIPILSLILGIALAFLIDGLDHTLKDSTEVENHLRLPVLGSVGRIR
ncbi:MAG: hypothetical protein KDA27_20765 [Candidatus Eisenbacteria bacterium]|uniref:Polysaccharide chain length determinant N-terminal domain-containing protein n=1 Tax=Eiseniibacteriota bacterium TaxID=2212470 RepID=A0A956SG64_UNCEI|nr:hypothetical protein [Candidatus Eisenbacteria bacterium]MCB9462365.1 hypothetical protein [Candidatus Eisenbacteria bacterium]